VSVRVAGAVSGRDISEDIEGAGVRSHFLAGIDRLLEGCQKLPVAFLCNEENPSQFIATC
jgi:hypothetical protein